MSPEAKVMMDKAVSAITDKIKDPEEFSFIAARLRKQKKRLVQCDGIFDLVHPGHAAYFAMAKTQGDILYVVLVTDRYVRKGPGRPVFDQETRALWVAGIQGVDYVVINDDYGPYKVIKAVKPDVLVKGDSYERDPTEGFLRDRSLVESYGGKLFFIPETDMHSTEIFKKIHECVNRSLGERPETTPEEKVPRKPASSESCSA
ncbi:MAG: adenylyltransferase/cytidyltransferase family protein [bacterium]|nr:adenylyltransferase/cytidyltransferase family protein [bacterium]